LLGGILSELDWRLIFALNLPVGVVALQLVTRTSPAPGRDVPFDRVGQVTAVLAMGGLTYGAIEAGSAGITAPAVLATFGIAVLALAGFGVAQTRVAHPMVPPDLFRSRNVAVLLGIGFAFMAGYWGLPFVISLYVQQSRGLSALTTGALFVPMMLVGAALTPFSARLAERLGRRTLIGAGLLSMTAGLAVLGLLPGSAPPWVLAALMVLVGLGGPLVMPTAMAVLLDSVPAHRAGIVSGLFNTGRQVGGALAVAVFGGLLADPDDILYGVHVSLLIAAAVVAAAAAATLLLRTKETS
jgi:MFS family permease